MSTYCFLVYTPSDKGTLIAHWSKQDHLDGGIMRFETKQKIPAYKLTQHGGRVSIITDIHSGKSKFFSGICQFVKMAKQVSGTIKVLDAPQDTPVKFDVYILKSGNVVDPVPVATEFTLEDSLATAALPRSCSELSLKKLTKEQFISKGNSSGGCISI